LRAARRCARDYLFYEVKMNRNILLAFIFSLALISPASAQSDAVIFHEDGFPSADSAASPEALLHHVFSNAQFATAAELKDRLSSAKLLVLPYGSTFPEDAWADIYAYLQRGGNLLVLGGRPFTRAAYRDGGVWKLRDYSVRYTRPLMIDQYQETPGSDDLKFESNPDIPLPVPPFRWKRGFSPIIHLSAVSLYDRGGSAGSIDSNLDALAWGTKDGRRMSAPVIQIDHLRNGFDGGRWVFLGAELSPDFFTDSNGAEIFTELSSRAWNGAEEFTVRPTLPLYLPGEQIELEVGFWPRVDHDGGLLLLRNTQTGELHDVPVHDVRRMGTIQITTFPADDPKHRSTVTADLSQDPILLPPPAEKGLHIIEAKLVNGSKAVAIYHSAFWIRDLDYLRSGPKLGVNENYFELDGKPLAVVGTTYMSSEVQRLYFDHPNVYIWDRDLRQIHDAGLNMIRTGWWTGWDKFADENGQPYERTLRTMEAYLMTARKYGLPVQFNFFAFFPEVLGGVNPYLDPEAVRKQTTLVSAVAGRFHDVPFLAYDLINEPSFSKHLWTMRPNGDWIEAQKWNEWLDKHYPNRADLAAAWNVPITSVHGAIPLPEEIDFTPRGMYNGRNSLRIYDYEMFAQESFANWVRTLREGIRGVGSQQLITIGQDEGGYQDRLSPAFFGSSVDFTTNHSWWQNDSILWDSLVAKLPGKAMLIQETGLQRELNLDETSRRTPENEAALFERKVAMSFVQGSGAIEWLWNTNSYMTEGNETPIGALRADLTEKPEATVMRNFAKFATVLRDHLHNPQPAQVAIIASQAAQYSALADLQIEAQRKAVRALAYYDHLTPYLIYENQIDKMGNPKLAILPSAQALTEKAWQALLKYVDDGGNLLITGPVDRDEHWQRVNRAAELVPGANAVPLTYHNGSIFVADATPNQAVRDLNTSSLAFDLQAQGWLESLRFQGDNFRVISRGKGRIFWAAQPVELAQNPDAAGNLYSYVAARIGIEPQFSLLTPLSPGVLVYPLSLDDSILYIVVSDNAEEVKIDLRDKSTGVRVTLGLQAEHAALVLIGRREKAMIYSSVEAPLPGGKQVQDVVRIQNQ
jgi:Beta-galactosidase